jgi:putative ABC transport system ATP-binding protein
VSTRATPVLELRQLRFRWPRSRHDCLDVESFEVCAGEQVFLHGPSGCGKSTLLALLGGVLLAQAGELRLLGEGWTSLSSWRRDAFRVAHVGFIFQQFNLLPYLSAMENVRLPCRLSPQRELNARVRFASSARQAEHLLEEMEIPAPLWARGASMLSVGQQQRVAAARALIGLPELVLADEPTSALDEARRGRFIELLLRVCREAGSALIFVSHDLRLAPSFSRSVALPAINGAADPEEPA